MGLAQGLLVVLEGRDVGPDREHPAVRQRGLVHPQPAAIQKIGFERSAGHGPAPRQRSGNQGLNIPAVDLGADPMPSAMPEDLDEGERALLSSQEDVPVRLIGIPEAVFGIVDRNSLAAHCERLHKATERLIVQI
jgi:hypothetical protein